MSKSEEIQLFLSAFELDILIDSVEAMKRDRVKAGDSLRTVRLQAISKALKEQATKF